MERELKVAYLAGVLDSDGWFTIHLNRKQSANPTFSPDFGLNQITPEAIDLAIELFGGKKTVIDYSKAKNRFSRKPMYHWQVMANDMLLALNELIPHLRIKRKQAEIIFRLRSDIVFHGRTGGKERSSLSPQTVAFREKLYAEFRAVQPPRVAETECEDSAESEKRQSELLSNEQSFTEMLEHLNNGANSVQD